MAFLDFGFGTGLAYKYDFNARDRRQRADRAEELANKRYSDQIAHQQEQEDKATARFEEQQQYTRDRTAIQDAKDQTNLFPISPYATRYQKESDTYRNPILEKIGAIENTPGFNSDPKMKADLQMYRRQLATMPGETELKSASEDYSVMNKAYQKDDIKLDEYLKEQDEWKKYENKEGKYANPNLHYSYIPKEKFSIHSAVDKFVSTGNFTTSYTYQNEDGQFRSITKLKDSGDMSKLVDGFYSKNIKTVTDDYNNLPENTRNGFGNGVTGVKKYIEWAISRNIDIGEQQAKSNQSGIPDYYTDHFKDKTEGSNLFIGDFIPLSGKTLNTNQLYFIGKDNDGKYSEMTTNPINTTGVNLEVIGGKNSITEWKRGADGQLYGKVRVTVTKEEFNMIKQRFDSSFNYGKEDPLNEDIASNISNNLASLEIKNMQIPDIDSDTDEPKEVVEFNTYVPFDNQGIVSFNSDNHKYKKYSNQPSQSPVTEKINSNSLFLTPPQN